MRGAKKPLALEVEGVIAMYMPTGGHGPEVDCRN